MKKMLCLLIVFMCCAVLPAFAEGLEVSFSADSGFYASNLLLEMRCTEGDAAIYYTLDGTVPDENSKRYTGALPLGPSNARADVLTRITDISGAPYLPKMDFPTGHVVRAIAIGPRGEKSAVVSATYLVGYDREKLYGDAAVMFLVTDPDGLFNYDTGIYAAGRYFAEWEAAQTEAWEAWQAQGNFSQRGDEWERPVSVTFLPAKGEGFTQLMGMRIKGGVSRANNQKSLRLIAREEYGEKKVDYVLYHDNVREKDGGVVDKYKSFTLRNGGNDAEFGRIRDPFIANLATGLRLETAQNMPCIAFLNGEYWGVYTLNEEYTDNYIQYHYGIDNKNVITLKVGEVDDGEPEDFALFERMFEHIVTEDMSDPDQYEKAAEMLDMGSFADFFALELYIANNDGPFQNNNWEMWRVRKPDGSHPYANGKWRMMLYDVDQSAGIYVDGSNANEDNITRDLTNDAYEGYHPALMLQALLENADFQAEFLRACCDIQNLYFTSGRVKDMMKVMSAEYLPLVPDTLRRFGPEWVTWDADRHVKTKMSQLEKYFTARVNCFLDLVQRSMELENPITITIKVKGKGEVYLNGRDLPVPKNAKVRYFPSAGLTITAVPAEGATFTGWTVSHKSAVVADPDAATTQVEFSRVFTLTANFK